MIKQRFIAATFLAAAFAAQSQASVTYKTSSDWGSGFNGEITIVNDSGAVLNNWTVEFDFNPNISSIWNAVITSRVGTHYVVKPASWNGQIAAGGTVSIGFGGAPGNVTAPPANLKLNGVVDPPTPPNPEPLPAGGIGISIVRTGQWPGGFGADIVITNGTSTAVNNWTLGFSLSQTITSLWNGTIISHVGSQYSVRNAAWNGAIPAGGSVSLGFNGHGTLGAASTTNCMFNGSPCTLTYSATVAPPSGAQGIVLSTVDSTTPAIWFTIPQGTNTYNLSLANPAAANFSVIASNSNVRAAVLSNNSLQVTGVAAGRASLKLTDSISGTTRYVGVRVRNADGTLPGMPKYLSVGSVSEDTTDDLAFWKSFEPGAKNKQVDVRYIYLNGGPVNGWDTWGNNPGDRATNYIRNSHQLGMIPFFVFYNIPDGGESYDTDLAHVRDATYLAGYFRNLKLALDIINRESPDDMVGMILEPDFLGYLAQNAGLPASSIAAMTASAYSSGVLTAADPQFPNTVEGLVKAINYTISKYAPQVYFGWQMNLWASPAGGWTTTVPGKGLMHKTETSGIAAGRTQIYNEAAAITRYYVNAGVLTSGAKFVSVDKYGLDATGFEASAARDPAGSYWFWNNDLWQNYLTFVKAMHETTKLPVILWQIPVGHINASQKANPYNGGLFPQLTNDNRKLEDSSPSFFFGDTFVTTGPRNTYFSANLGGDQKVRVSGDTIRWDSHMSDAAAAGVVSVMFGAGVGASTGGTGYPPTDSYWWITAVQNYYLQPVPLQ